MNNEQEFKYVLEEGEEQETVDLAGYQVTKAELFAHTRRILLQNCKYPSKSVMKRNIGLRLRKRQVSFQKMLQKVFCTIAVQSAEC